MVIRCFCLVVMVALCAGMISCQPLNAVEHGKSGELQVEASKFRDAIPSEYGKVLAITTSSDNPDIATFWFEKADGTIVGISVFTRQGRLSDKILVIPRR